MEKKLNKDGEVKKTRGIIEEFNHKGWNVKHFVDKSYDDDYWYFVFNSTPFEFDTKEKAIKELDSLIKKYKYEHGGELGEKYYDYYSSINKGIDLYYFDKKTNDFDIYVGNYKTIKEAEEKAKNDGYVKRPMWMRYEHGGELGECTYSIGGL